METKLRAKLQEFHCAKVLGKDVSRVVVSVNVEDVNYPFVVHFTNIVVADVDVFRPRLCDRILL